MTAAPRRKGDSYPTPTVLAQAIVHRLIEDGIINPETQSRVLEPSAGSGNFVRALAEQGFSNITAVEPQLKSFLKLEKSKVPGLTARQETLEEFLQGPLFHRFPLIVGNPPFSLGESHVRLCFDHLTEGGIMAMLLPLPFFVSEGRRELWEETDLFRVYPLRQRPSFTKTFKCPECSKKVSVPSEEKYPKWCTSCDPAQLLKPSSSSDSVTYATFVWWRGFKGHPELRHLDWKEKS